MFDATSRTHLEELLGYERFVLTDCKRQLREAQGYSSPLELFIKDTDPGEMRLQLHDTFGGGGTIAVYNQLAGLLFSAAYKVVDMIVEWTLRENGMPANVWRFSEKVKWLAQSKPIFPDFLGADAQLRDVLLNCYREFLPLRNAMTHGRWGALRNGSLHFDFVDNSGTHRVLVFTREQVFTWADAISQVGAMLITPSTATSRSINAVKRQLDQLQSHHKGPLFNIPEALTYRVIRHTEQVAPFTVDIDRIRKSVAHQANGKSYEIQFRIEQGPEGQRTYWEIPPEEVPTHNFVLDARWDRFKVTA